MIRNRTHEKRIKNLEDRVDTLAFSDAHYDVMHRLLREAIRDHFHDTDGVTMFRTDLGDDLRVEGHPLEGGRT